MKTKQVNKLNMYNAVYGVLNENKETWTRVYQLKDVFGKFEKNNNRLAVLKTEQEKDLQPFLNAMLEKRERLIVLSTPVANIVLAYAHDKKEKELHQKMNVSKNKLAKSKDSDLIEKCRTIYKAAKKLCKKSIGEAENTDKKAINILEYGLTEKMVVDLDVAVKDFIKSCLEFHEAITGKDKTGKEITSVLKKNKKLIENKIDLLISIFETSNPDFYKSYQEARVIQKIKEEKIKIKKEKKSKKEEQAENEITE